MQPHQQRRRRSRQSLKLMYRSYHLVGMCIRANSMVFRSHTQESGAIYQTNHAPGGSFDATKDWLVHSASSEIERNSAGIAGRLILDVNTKSYQEFRTQKAGTPHVYAVKDGKEYWAASATVDVEFDDYSPGDQYPVPIEKTIKGTNIYKLYSDYEGGVSAGWRFPVKNGIVTIWLPGLYAYNMVTGEITGDTDAYKKLHADILKSIDITQ